MEPDEKKIYVYPVKNGKKDRKKGIIRYYQTGWDIFADQENFIKANITEVSVYLFGNQIRKMWKWLSKEDYKNTRRLGTALVALATITVLTLSNYKTILKNMGL